MMKPNIKQLIEKLKLEPSTDSRTIYNSSRKMDNAEYSVQLHQSGRQTKWHKAKYDLIIHFCSGDPLLIYFINEKNRISEVRLGNPLISQNTVYNHHIPQGKWFATKVEDDKLSYSLISSTLLIQDARQQSAPLTVRAKIAPWIPGIAILSKAQIQHHRFRKKALPMLYDKKDQDGKHSPL